MSEKADFRALADTIWGIGVHWTTWTAPLAGLPVPIPFPEAVERFDVPRFVDLLRYAGAGHLLFTINHELHWLPCPHPAVDAILPGRTCERDLIGELIAALRPHGIRLMLYYHHGCDARGQDPAWQEAVGGYDADPSRLYGNMARVVAGLGERYGRDVIGWWFDAGYALDRRGNTPWDALAAAGKAGHPGRLVCFNPGVGSRNPMTDRQDYWPGEAEDLATVPDGPTAPGGLPWYTFTTWHRHAGGLACWGIDAATRDASRTTPSVEQISAYVDAYRSAGGAVTFNLPVYQDGTMHAPDLQALRAFRRSGAK